MPETKGPNADDGESWLDLEKLATRIYAELEPHCAVTHDARLEGHLSRAARQIDVLIENPTLGTRVVVDCKDWKHKVTVPEALAFAGLLEDVDATSGVLICNRGFSKATRNVAKAKGFQLARLHDVESRKWNLDVRLPIVWTTLSLKSLDLGLKARLEKGDQIATNEMPRFSRDGVTVDVQQFFEDAWNRGELHMGTPGEGTLTTTLDWEPTAGRLAEAAVTITYGVSGAAKLGYVTP